MKRIFAVFAVGALGFFPFLASAAIAFDTSAITTYGASPKTLSYTAGALSNSIIFACIGSQGTIGTPTANGVNMTNVSTNNNATAGFNIALYYSIPTTTVNQIVDTSTDSLFISASSYTGVAQTSPIDVFGNYTGSAGESSPVTSSLTTTVDNDWMILCSAANSSSAPAAGTGTTQRRTIGAGNSFLGDTNGALTPPGSKSMSLTYVSFPHAGEFSYNIMAAFCPATGCAAPAYVPTTTICVSLYCFLQ